MLQAASSVVSVTLLYIVESDSAAILQNIQIKSSITGSYSTSKSFVSTVHSTRR